MPAEPEIWACMADAVLDNDAAGHAVRVAAWLARAEALHDRALTKQESARLRFEQGRLAELTGDAVTAAARYIERPTPSSRTPTSTPPRPRAVTVIAAA